MKVQILNEMPNILKSRTGLPYDIWIDSQGDDRNIPHHIPRLKIKLDKTNYIPVSITNNPEILSRDSQIPKFRICKKWIIKNLNILLKRWNNEIDDKTMVLNLKRIED